jgi:hypothetical protein
MDIFSTGRSEWALLLPKPLKVAEPSDASPGKLVIKGCWNISRPGPVGPGKVLRAIIPSLHGNAFFYGQTSEQRLQPTQFSSIICGLRFNGSADNPMA